MNIHCFERTDAEAKTPILWPPDVKNWLIVKYPGAGKDWRQEEKETTGKEMVDGVIDSMDMSLSKLRELMDMKPGMLQSMGSQRVVHDWETKLNWLSLFACTPWITIKKLFKNFTAVLNFESFSSCVFFFFGTNWCLR